jgi:cob(I)alamin adenosyltransferase
MSAIDNIQKHEKEQYLLTQCGISEECKKIIKDVNTVKRAMETTYRFIRVIQSDIIALGDDLSELEHYLKATIDAKRLDQMEAEIQRECQQGEEGGSYNDAEKTTLFNFVEQEKTWDLIDKV